MLVQAYTLVLSVCGQLCTPPQLKGSGHTHDPKRMGIGTGMDLAPPDTGLRPLVVREQGVDTGSG